MQKIFSYDAKTNGLMGQAFSIGVIVADEQGNEIDRFVGRCPIEEEVDPWVKENVLPEMESIENTHDSYDSLLKGFNEFWNKHKDNSVALVHMGVPVEAKLWIDMYQKGIIGPFDAPYNAVDVASFSQVSDSVDSYNAENGIQINEADYAGGTHNPLYDSAAALAAYIDVMQKGQELQQVYEIAKGREDLGELIEAGEYIKNETPDVYEEIQDVLYLEREGDERVGFEH